MKNFYVVYYAEQDKNDRTFAERINPEYKPGFYAGVFKMTTNDNMLSVLSSIGGIKAANICETKKQADEIKNVWNDGFKANGTYFFE